MEHGASAFPWKGMEEEIQAPPDKASSPKKYWKLFLIFLWLVFIIGGGVTYFHNKFTSQIAQFTKYDNAKVDFSHISGIPPSQIHSPPIVVDGSGHHEEL